MHKCSLAIIVGITLIILKIIIQIFKHNKILIHWHKQGKMDHQSTKCAIRGNNNNHHNKKTVQSWNAFKQTIMYKISS